MKIFWLVLFFPVILAAQTTIGPLTLGKPLPKLPTCKRLDKYDSYNFSGQGPCQYQIIPEGTRSIYNIPFDGAQTTFDFTRACWRRANAEANCPVELIAFDVDEQDCNAVLDGLRRKFGTPRVSHEWVQNGFGARWQRIYHDWTRPDGTLSYTVHQHLRGCFFQALTPAYAAIYKSPRVNF